MAAQTTSETSTGMKPTLGLTGVTINAMALIAPGAFLWIEEISRVHKLPVLSFYSASQICTVLSSTPDAMSCPSGDHDTECTIAALAQAINRPINIIAGSTTPSIAEPAQLGAARISFDSGLMCAVRGISQIA